MKLPAARTASKNGSTRPRTKSRKDTDPGQDQTDFAKALNLNF